MADETDKTNASSTAETDAAKPKTGDGTTAEQQATPNAYPTIEQFKKVAPEATDDSLKKNVPHILKAMCGAGLTSKNQLIAVVATIVVETSTLEPIKEQGSEAYLSRYNGRSDLGNNQPGDGPKFCGRGYIQITGRANYTAASKDLQQDYVGNPDLAMQPEHAAKIFIWYWKGSTGNNPSKSAESGNWEGVRRAVNGGLNGWDKFKKAVDRAIPVFTQDLDPNAIGAMEMPPGYGLGCVDPGGAGSKTIAAGANPSSQGEALAWALGLMMRDRARTHEARMRLNIAAKPEVLKLEPQKAFTLAGVGAEIDGKYVLQDSIVYPLRRNGPEMSVIACKPDPNAPPIQTFGHGNTGEVQQFASAAVPAGDIPGKIYQAGISNKGQSSAAGPGGGNVACAWSVGKYCILPAGLNKLGDGPYGSNAVAGIIAAINAGRGVKVPKDQVVPGDIWCDWRGNQHVGIFVTAGGTRVLSNSSSKASFVWEDSIEGVSKYYGGKIGDNFFRVTS